MSKNQSIGKTRFQVLLDPEVSEALDELAQRMRVSRSDAVQDAIQRLHEMQPDVVEEGAGAPCTRQTGAATRWPPWWDRLCDVLEKWKAEGRAVETKTGVRNEITEIDRQGGTVTLRSERSGRGRPRILDVNLLSVRGATRHGVIVRVLREIADSVSNAGDWHGPFRLRDLLANCLDDRQDWPPENNGVYVVTRSQWEGAPDAHSTPLYVGSTTGRSARFCTRVGDLIADAFGFYGSTTGHSSGGIKLYRYCCLHSIHPGELYLGWYSGDTICSRCQENYWYDELQPALNVKRPPVCRTHVLNPSRVP